MKKRIKKKLENDFSKLKEKVYILDDNQKDKYKDEINLIYETERKGNYNIFGLKFVEINGENIELDINGKKSYFYHSCELQKGKNNIKMKIKKN